MEDRWQGWFDACDGAYNHVVRHAVVVLGFMACASCVLLGAITLVSMAMGFDDVEHLWTTLAIRVGGSTLGVKLVMLGVIQLNFLLVFRTMLANMARSSSELALGAWWRARSFDLVLGDDGELGVPDRLMSRRVWFAPLGLLLLSPLLLQPTLVSQDYSRDAMYERTVNFLGGEAAFASHESLLGLYHRSLSPRASVDGISGVSDDAFDTAIALSKAEDRSLQGLEQTPPKLGAAQPMMDRWDPMIWEVVGQDARKFSQLKAVMWIESAGRQFAISHTGCAGLMQFCSGTARRGAFRKIFGAGKVWPCRCSRTSCRVSRRTQRDMEKGDRRLLERHEDGYPCSLGDARFDARRSIQAGAAYLKSLDSDLGGNLALMYIGYNSGPAVARAIFKQVGADATLEDIGAELVAALRPYYGRRASKRASRLLRRHLPKLLRARDRYASAAGLPPLSPVIASMPHLDAPPEKPPGVDRTGDGFTQKASPPRLLEVPTTQRLSTRVMPGIALGVSRADVIAQEGEGALTAAFRETRQRDPDRPLHPEASLRDDLATVPPIAYQERFVFGLSAPTYIYSMHPHTGAYDDLRVTLIAPTGEKPERAERFFRLRDRITTNLGAPTREQLLTRHEDLGARVTPAELDVEWRSHRTVLLSIWEVGELRVSLSTLGGSPNGRDTHVAELQLWASSADDHHRSLATRWAGFTPAVMPAPGAPALYEPPGAQVAFVPAPALQPSKKAAPKPVKIAKKVSKKTSKRSRARKRRRSRTRSTRRPPRTLARHKAPIGLGDPWGNQVRTKPKRSSPMRTKSRRRSKPFESLITF